MIPALLLAAFLAASSVPPTPRPAWCQKGWACVPTAEIEADAAYKIDLAERLAIAEAKAKRRLTWHLGCGPGIGFVVDTGWDAKAAPIPLMCGVVYGF